ncbi:MAG: putative endonuclease [Cycloclasticus sp.]|jgi:putative endonuclease|tara:strand:+ start:3092 stop:3334 length:243 start_codon:yes stop_codon:yes gene_type:complete
MSWYVYIIEASDNTLYTGITTDLERRFKQHLAGTGAKYFKGRTPESFVYTEGEHDRSSASIREAVIKKLTRREKLQLIKR